jgi:AraC-like DNA-binding protein
MNHSDQKSTKPFSQGSFPDELKFPQVGAANSLIGRLRNSELFRSYRNIFRNSTGLPLVLHAVNSPQLNEGQDITGGNPFCQMLNGGKLNCPQCVNTHGCLFDSANRGVQSVRCFADIVETAVPVTQGGQVVAQLATGHICYEEPTIENFANFMGTLGEDATKDLELERAYLDTPVLKEEKYLAMVTLLAAFSLQLNELASQIVLELRHEKSDPIACAKDYIDENLCETIILDEVASEIHMSRYYLCRRFKESTGMTLTEYVSTRRVEMAKDMLENTSLRVADIAFEVGFQSLSQFNRAFQRVTRNTPTKFRRTANAA